MYLQYSITGPIFVICYLFEIIIVFLTELCALSSIKWAAHSIPLGRKVVKFQFFFKFYFLKCIVCEITRLQFKWQYTLH